MAEQLLLVNPSKRKRAKRKAPKRRRPKARRRTKRKPARRTKSKISRIRRTRRRNPARFNVGSFVRGTFMPSATGAVGALGLDVLLGVLPLPINFQTGPMRPLVKMFGAVVLGMAANMVVSRKTAEQFTAGALTVVLYDVAKGVVQNNFPQIPLDGLAGVDMADYPELGYADPLDDDSALGAYVEDGTLEGMEAYVEDDTLEGIALA